MDLFEINERSPISRPRQFIVWPRCLGSIGGASRLRSSSFKKPPEPLRRAVADCLSSTSGGGSSSTTSAFHHVAHAVVSSEASRTLRDYLAASSTTDQVYSAIIDHTIAEKERSPAVVARCVSLLKRYLLREEPPASTFRPRAHPVFQYRHYSLMEGELVGPFNLGNPGEFTMLELAQACRCDE
ncbi:hypothetical protein ACFE04_023189 [Oxalis oulophora]